MKLALKDIYRSVRGPVATLGLAASVVFGTAANANAQGLNAKPATTVLANNTSTTTTKPATDTITPTISRQASNYSVKNDVIGIAIFKGKKDESGLTGEKIGEILVGKLKQGKWASPSKYFVDNTNGGDYTTVMYFVNGYISGPYGLNKSLEAIGQVQEDYSGMLLSKYPTGIKPAPSGGN